MQETANKAEQSRTKLINIRGADSKFKHTKIARFMRSLLPKIFSKYRIESFFQELFAKILQNLN